MQCIHVENSIRMVHMYIFISLRANVLALLFKIIKEMFSLMIPRYCNVLLFLTATLNTRQLYSRSSPVWPVQAPTTMPALWPPEPPLPMRKIPLLHNPCTAVRYISREIWDLGEFSVSHCLPALNTEESMSIHSSINFFQFWTKKAVSNCDITWDEFYHNSVC